MRRLLRPPTRAYRGLLGSALRAFHASSIEISSVLVTAQVPAEKTA